MAPFPHPATPATIQLNKAVFDSLPFYDDEDFEDASKGFIAEDNVVTITDDDGTIVWDIEEYKKFIKDEMCAPNSVNPSLWRNALLCMKTGLFEVQKDTIYQIRNYDLSNVTFVRSDIGWVVFDCLKSLECAQAAMDLFRRKLSDAPIVAVVYSHSHIDHFGGVRGIINEDDVKAGKVKVIAPYNFTEHALSENVIAGNAMGRRAIYMYGSTLPRNERGSVNSGLGQTVSTGASTIILPTDIVDRTGQEITVDGLRMIFQFTPGSEAPTEMNTWFPDMKVMWMAENCTNTMHNILTLRGAQVRDAKKWAEYLNETIDLYGDEMHIKFQSHHWPMWGNSKIVDYLKKQRDCYKYIHDQTVHMMNNGYIGSEISEMIRLPPTLEQNWNTRGYYGSLRHNSRAVYQFYMGWYSGNPSDLNNLPPEAVGRKYVEYMGGAKKVVERAKEDFTKGEYRWVAEALKHVVFADPKNESGKALLANAYEQLGYQAESGAWRSVYLQGADELRNGVQKSRQRSASLDILKTMPVTMVFDFLAVNIIPEKAEGEKWNMEMHLKDDGESEPVKYNLAMEHSVLNYSTKLVDSPDVTVTITKTDLFTAVNVPDKERKSGSAAADAPTARTNTEIRGGIRGGITLDGNEEIWKSFLGMIDRADRFFNIVTP